MSGRRVRERSCPDRDEIREQVRKAERAEQRGDWDRATALYGQALRAVRKRVRVLGRTPIPERELKRRQGRAANHEPTPASEARFGREVADVE